MISMRNAIFTNVFLFASFDVEAFVTIFSEISILSLNQLNTIINCWKWNTRFAAMRTSNHDVSCVIYILIGETSNAHVHCSSLGTWMNVTWHGACARCQMTRRSRSLPHNRLLLENYVFDIRIFFLNFQSKPDVMKWSEFVQINATAANF